MAHLHADMERLDIHIAVEVWGIVIESATLVNDVLFDCEKPLRRNEGSNKSDE
jgi:hypothetical protein